jgi:hypothetical protein
MLLGRLGGRSRAGLTIGVIGLAACAGTHGSYFTVGREIRGATTTLRLIPAAGARINARLKPALERPDGSVLRFDSPHLTPDSSYYTAPPELSLSGSGQGIVRASVCPAGEAVCRLVQVRSEK